MAGELGCDILQNQNLLSGAFFLMVKKKSFLLPIIQTLKYVHSIRKYFFIVSLPLTCTTLRMSQIPLERQTAVSRIKWHQLAGGLTVSQLPFRLFLMIIFKPTQPSFLSSFEQGQHKQFPVFYLSKVYFLFQQIMLTGKLFPG